MTVVLTLDDRGVANEETVERVLQAGLFFADQVLMRASCTFYGPGAAESARKLDELTELGVLRRWVHEYEADNGTAHRLVGAQKERIVPDIVLPQSSVISEVARIDDVLRISREDANLITSQPVRQGITELTELRQRLLFMSLSFSMGSQGLLAAPRVRRILNSGSEVRGDSSGFEGEVINELVRKMQLGPLSTLSAEDIAICRQHSAAFRDYLESQLTDTLRVPSGTRSPGELADSVLEAYREVMERHPPSLRNTLGSEGLWDIIGALLPPALIIKYTKKLWTWDQTRRQRKPFLLLSELRQRGGGRNI